MSEKKTPQIRFKGFADDWQERDFNEVFNTSIPTNTLSRAMLTDEETKIKNIHYGDVLIKFSEITHNDKDVIPFIINDDINKYADHFLQNGDIIFADAAEDETAGKATEVIGIHDCYVVSGLHTIVARAVEKFAPKYFGYYLNSNSYHGQLVPLMQGTKVLSISKSTLANTIIKYPESYSEQTRIGEFFKTLDNLISSHQRKYDKLRQVKKSLLEKMFPQQGATQPQIRFNGFIDDWEERVLGEYTHITTGKLDANAMAEDGIYDFYTSGIKKYKINTFAFQGPAITIAGNGATVGYMHLADGLFNAYQRTYVLSEFLADRYFLFCSIKEALPLKIKNEARTGNIPYIVLDMLTNLRINISSFFEQTRIGAFFKTLDDLIAAQLRELDKLKSTKKALLEKMFV